MHRKNEAATVTLFKLCWNFLSYKWKKGNINVKV